MILDMTCGSKMGWIDKNHPDTIYMDRRKETHTLTDGRQVHITPDIQAAFTQLPFKNETFTLVYFDPPHLTRAGTTSWVYAKYGALLPDWPEHLKAAFHEAFRVLKPNGVLIFKWNETHIPLNRITPLSPHPPLFGHKSGKHSKTHWLTYIKPPCEKNT